MPGPLEGYKVIDLSAMLSGRHRSRREQWGHQVLDHEDSREEDQPEADRCQRQVQDRGPTPPGPPYRPRRRKERDHAQ